MLDAQYNVTFAWFAIYPNIKYVYPLFTAQYTAQEKMKNMVKMPTHIIMHELHEIHFKVRQLIRYSATLNYYYFLLRAVNKTRTLHERNTNQLPRWSIINDSGYNMVACMRAFITFMNGASC